MQPNERRGYFRGYFEIPRDLRNTYPNTYPNTPAHRNTPCPKMLKSEIPIEIPLLAEGIRKEKIAPVITEHVISDKWKTIAARLMAFEMLICHKLGDEMPCIGR